MRSFFVLLAATLGCGFLLPQVGLSQLIPKGNPIPRTGNLPVVFLNGQETDCSVVSFQHSFGIADQVLQANGRASLFFNNCDYGTVSIEKLGGIFGTYLTGLTYTDGQPVGMVDVVGYSMGGLIVRSYMEGKQETNGVFTPPATTQIHKAIFIASPNFGTPVAALGFGFDRQLEELSSGSHFLMDLNTWNQNHDDLRGVDAIGIIGNGGTGLATTKGFDDGLVPLSSGSLRFYMPGRTRILPRCHQPAGRLLTQTGLCPQDAVGISYVTSSTDDNVRIIVSYLNGTPDWQSIGTAAEQNSFLQTGGGLLVRARTNTDVPVMPDSIVATPSSGSSKSLNMSNSEIGYTDLIAAGNVALKVNSSSASFTQTVNLPAGGSEPFVVKPGPMVNRVAASAAALFPLVLAPRMIVSIYGSNLAQSTAQAGSPPVPFTLSDVTVRLKGAQIGLFYVSPQQINAVLPDGVSGLIPLTIQNAAGSQTLNLWIEPAFPAVFTLDQSGGGAAAALNSTNNQIVSSSNPLHAGEYLELFLTGLGTTVSQGGLAVAKQQPTITVGGLDCPVTYAGGAPGFPGLDQINCRIPSGLGAQPGATVIVHSGSRSSQPTTVAVQ